MYLLLNKLFIRNFYGANAGFFLFFFFIFFGAVQGGSLISYHMSLMKSMLSSGVTLGIVLCCWLLYHLKCISFILKIINSEEGKFLYNIQALSLYRQKQLYFIGYLGLYAPVFIYSIIVSIIGFRWGYSTASLIILLFQCLSSLIVVFLIYDRLNNWIRRPLLLPVSLSFPKYFLIYNLAYFTSEKRTMFLLLKAFSLALLYISLVWNKGKYDNDSFLLFYLLILIAHAILPYLSVQFLEKQLSFTRNLPISVSKRALFFILSYIVLLLPEAGYLIYHATAFPLEHRIAYCINIVASLFLMTAIQYADAVNRNEYLKACFALFFFSIFALHLQAFWIWIGIQSTIGMILFMNGFYHYEVNKK